MNIASPNTIAKILSKEIIIKTHEQEKCMSLQYYVLLLMLLNYLHCWSLRDSPKEAFKRK